MKFPFHPWRRLLLCALPFAALLTACDDGKKEPPPKPAEVTTYNSVPWDALPATSDADLLAGFNAWRSACARLAKDPVWGEPCASATTVAADPTAVRAFLQERMQVYSLRSSSNGDQGLITGYYEPVYHGSLNQGEKTPVPVYGVPDDLVVVALESVYPELKGKRLRGRLEGRVLKPYDDAATIRDNGSSAPVLAWLGDPMDLQFLQIQGSGRIQLEDGRQLRIGYGDQNGHPYKPVGRWLVEQGLVPKEEISMKRIRDWAEANPQRVSELLASNPSFVFFSLRPDSDEGPRGSLNVPLTDGYSVAIDRKVIPLGSLMWLSTTRPDDGSAVVRPVAAQDTGGAIVGEVRADLFWGTGDAAGELAGHMKQPGRLWLLWPKGAPLPAS
ncbi:murein transglycosylase A [Pseudomonas aeruginosa]|uniref:murein transglycosylase A n=1 Tax=Pseudomonas aeruginosa TaxID=287 RepID=UPI0003B950B2|nr:murein transglycosylase A [Pseudomonas aeruginosa]EIU2896459.1 murein transglycosylase A [Pseudomonas aeruginosa]EIU2917706.1 murein transglycosylase A [Pseudomonas aeruginosa]EJN6723160.1 murein transglycosylase A [Pseudomonas aeruginosa]EKU2415639.1 murein transglycosylase A [Pseudomonas aeruginosa]EKU3898595.1 murein transglycosylase A [Pseudomonas aeruginosa]